MIENLGVNGEVSESIIIQLLKKYPNNLLELEQYQENEIISEWQGEYHAYMQAREKSEKQEAGQDGSTGSIEENRTLDKINSLIMKEKRYVLAKIQAVQMEVQLVKILMMGLERKSELLISLRYFNKLSVAKVCDELFISRSTYYRQHERIMKKMAGHYDKIFFN